MTNGLKWPAYLQTRKARDTNALFVPQFQSNIFWHCIEPSRHLTISTQPSGRWHWSLSLVVVALARPQSAQCPLLILGFMSFAPQSMFALTSSFYYSLSCCSVSFTNLRDGSRSASFHIPWTKTTREEGASVIVTARSDLLCPCTALRDHLGINRDVPGSSSLFAYTTRDGQWEHMTKYKFMSFCTDIWLKAALAHVLGHSFRIGGAVELLLAGVSPEVVAATGGWTSLAFLLYWRRMEEIIPMSTSRAYQRSHIVALAKIFEKFRVDHHIPSNFTAFHDCVDDL